MQKIVSTDEIRALLRGADAPLTHAEIRDALEYSKDDDCYISARLSTLVRRPRNFIKVTWRGDRRAWYSELKMEKAA